MKRVFIFISTILFSCYLVTMIVQQNQQISFSSYNAVDVTGQALTDHKVSNRKEVTDALTNLANEHNSLIARRIVQPNEKGEIDFRYQFYGHVSPPSNLKRASQESAEGSDIVDLPNKGFKGCGNQACFGAKHDESNVIIIYR